MIDARHYVYLCEADPGAGDSARYLVRFDNFSAGIYCLADEDVQVILSYPGVDCLLKLVPGINIDLDPRTLVAEVL